MVQERVHHPGHEAGTRRAHLSNGVELVLSVASSSNFIKFLFHLSRISMLSNSKFSINSLPLPPYLVLPCPFFFSLSCPFPLSPLPPNISLPVSLFPSLFYSLSLPVTLSLLLSLPPLSFSLPSLLISLPFSVSLNSHSFSLSQQRRARVISALKVGCPFGVSTCCSVRHELAKSLRKLAGEPER